MVVRIIMIRIVKSCVFENLIKFGNGVWINVIILLIISVYFKIFIVVIWFNNGIGSLVYKIILIVVIRLKIIVFGFINLVLNLDLIIS